MAPKVGGSSPLTHPQMVNFEQRIILRAVTEDEGLRPAAYGCLFPFFLAGLSILFFLLKSLEMSVACFILYILAAEALSGTTRRFEYVDVDQRKIVLQSWRPTPFRDIKLFEKSNEYPITDKSAITSIQEVMPNWQSLVFLPNGIPDEHAVKLFSANDVQPIIQDMKKRLNIKFLETDENHKDLVRLIDAPHGRCKRCGDPLGPPNTYGNMGSGICYSCWNN